MPRRLFKTVSDKLLEYAEAAYTDFYNRGYNVKIEKSEIGFPYTPTLLCKRHSTIIIIEVDAQLSIDRMNAWVSYARSSGQDTRIALCLPMEAAMSQADEAKLRNDGVGFYFASDQRLTEIIPPKDLGLNVHLPPLNSLPRKIRPLLGSAYEQFDRSHWREGFEDACQALENEARRYLRTDTRRGRIKIVTKKGLKTLTYREINKMTLGQLAENFSNISAQNHADSVIGQTLKRINKDRVGVVHRKFKATTEKRLRTNVGKHMWAIVAALKELV